MSTAACVGQGFYAYRTEIIGTYREGGAGSVVFGFL